MKPAIIAFAPHRWQDRWLSRQHLLSRLAAMGWPVLYSFGPLSWWQRETPLWQQSSLLGSFAQQDGVVLDQPGRFPPRWPGRPWWDQRVWDFHARRLQKRMAGRKILVFCFHPSFLPLVQRLAPSWLVYHVYDVFSLMESWTPQLASWEKALVEEANLITTSSPAMAHHLPSPGPWKARLLDNGGDIEPVFATANAPCPPDLAAIPHPRIGYAGTINAKVDLAMILHVARERPQWHWVVLGPVLFSNQLARDQSCAALWQECLSLPNVHHLGNKPRQEVPAYLHHMDTLTICYRVTAEDWVVHGYPVKFHEYLATGKPLVVAPQSILKERFSHVTALATTPQEWLVCLGEALAGVGVGDVNLRQQVARENGWQARAERLQEWLLEVVASPIGNH
ncbi:MAG: glycosyltransferase family 1 protein [Magnetococcales bacterium]|nr:hypothetical protein [Magnetococcales bacterium]NGZ25690.1 glycosyltransferase family 1 protein [Magnetococcales bacterium]